MSGMTFWQKAFIISTVYLFIGFFLAGFAEGNFMNRCPNSQGVEPSGKIFYSIGWLPDLIGYSISRRGKGELKCPA